MTDGHEFSFPCIKIQQPIGNFYVGAIDSNLLCNITMFDIRRIEKERDIETYLGIQRPLNPSRVKEITEYVKTIDACFPTGVILAVDGENVSFDETTHRMVIATSTNDGTQLELGKIARVLDGQHRIEGLRGYNGESFQVNVSIFVDIDIAEQAYIFSTVNLAQTKVNKSLVYDLYELSKTRSPEKLCHDIAVALDCEDSSPFFRRIKRLGVATEGRFTETITQATFVGSLLRYMSKNPLSDRDIYKRGGSPKRADEMESRSLIFRNMMINRKDLDIADVLWNYFDAVRQRWPKAWGEGGQGLILNRTNGFKALMRFLKDAYLSITVPGGVPTTENFLEIFTKIDLEDNEFVVDRFKPGSSGESELYRVLFEKSGLSPQEKLDI